MDNARPFFNLGTGELESSFISAADDVEALTLIRNELHHRSKRPARELLERVENKLRDLEARAHSLLDVSEPEPATPATIQELTVDWVFDDFQQRIVEADPSVRMIVNAPPGTGKTAVACGRIAWLLQNGIPAHQILLFSFTRTAIRELRNRIDRLADRHMDVWSVKVSTLDSRAWTLVQGFNGTRVEDRIGGHDGTIAEALGLLRSDHDAVYDFLDEIAHVVVDEAQDLVGVRGEFVMELIARVPSSAGVTVLTDDAQSIYGFAEDDSSDFERGTLPERIRERKPLAFHETELRTVYRTGSPTLKRLYVDGRRQLLDAIAIEESDGPRVVRECIRKWNDGRTATAKQESPEPGTLQLYRTRIEVLDASCWLADRGTVHRIRMSGLPPVLHPWIGLALGDFYDEFLTREKFVTLWPRVQHALPTAGLELESCWNDMLRVARERGMVSMLKLRSVLSRTHPPVEFLTSELGLAGPILGTIHASKGREADHVHLMLPAERESEEHPDEEARVLFVGATRARTSLRVGKGQRGSGSTLSSGRATGWMTPNNRVRVEIGRAGDIDPTSPVSQLVFESANEVLAGQSLLERALSGVSPIRAWQEDRANQWAYTLREGASADGQVLGRLAGQVNYSLREAKNRFDDSERLMMPKYIGPLCMLSTGTVVLDAGDPALGNVHYPWAESGIWLAPVVIGLPTIPFFTRR